MSHVPRQIITLQNLPAAHAVIGEGQPLLMLHGWGASIDLVWSLAERLAPLGYRVYALDMPGFGNTPNPPVDWSVHDYVKFILDYLDSQSLERLHLFGHSFGGRLGLILAADHAERLLKMTLADAAGIRDSAPASDSLRLKSYRLALNTLKAVGLRAQADQLRGWYTERYGSADYKAASGTLRETFVKVVNEDLRDYASRVRVPTLLFWGDQDTDTPLSQGKLLEQLIPDAGLVVWEGAGHYSYLERLADTARVMDHFFKG
jgi:pimeloyl-ACP methyl ester carboxylesterase